MPRSKPPPPGPARSNAEVSNALRAAIGKNRRNKRKPIAPDKPPATAKPKVGYGQPPIETQFKKGVSGNPKGRPKGRKSIATIVQKAVSRRVQITRRGEISKVALLEAMMEMALSEAMNKNFRFFTLILDILEPKGAVDTEAKRPRPQETKAIYEKMRAIRKLLEGE